MHDYERILPTYQGKANNQGPMYIVNGAGGNREGTSNNFESHPSIPSTFHSDNFGVALLTTNCSTLHWEFHDSATTNILDQFTFTK